MVSLLSFFTGKKKSRRAPSPPPTAGQSAKPSAGPGSPNRARTSRFLSLRHKGSGRLSSHGGSSKRASSEVARKRSHRKKEAEADLPRLALNWETAQDGQRGRSSLGLEGMGKSPRLESGELAVLDDQRFGWNEVVQGWKWFGKAFRDTGLDTPGIMLPGKAAVDQDNQHLLLALFTLAMTPTLDNRFPSITSYYQSISSNPDQPESSWSVRLASCITDTQQPADLAECLKYILRRLDPPASSSGSPADMPLNAELYKAFIKAEMNAGHPLDAYEKLFVPRVPVGMRGLLDEVFDLCAAVAAHSDNNGLSGSKLIGLIAWWIWGCPSADTAVLSWDGLYSEWSTAWKRVEHLFLAWIRNQSTRMTLPTKLLQLVEAYPFGDCSGSTDFLPSPPPSSFHRHALHITLTSSGEITDRKSPTEILKKAASAEIGNEDNLPMWKGLVTDNDHSLDTLVEETSSGFLDLSSPRHATDNGLGLSHTDSPGDIANGSIGRPFSPAALPPSQVSRQSSLPHADAQTVQLGPPISFSGLGLTSTSPEAKNLSSRMLKQPSTSTLQLQPTRSDSWDAFKDSGFGPTLSDELELSPRVDVATPLQESHSVGGESDADYAAARRIVDDGQAYAVDREEVVEIDDLFLPFVQDCQRDSTSTPRWPSFALVRLRTPVAREAGDLEWLLVTTEHRNPPVFLESPPLALERSSSPTESAINKSLGFFRRSSSFGGKTSSRRSLFAPSRNSRKASASSFALSTLSENGFPTGAKSAESLPSGPLPVVPAATDTLKAQEDEHASRVNKSGEILVPDVPRSVQDTAPNDWIYRAEGGAHLIFTYAGSSPSFSGRVLRIRKPTSPMDAHEAAGILWKEKLLPKLLSSKLILSSQPVDLDVEWVKTLLGEAEKARPESRRQGEESLADMVTGPVKGSIMDDTTAVGNTDTETILSIEIKPKWGFLPRAESVTPPEAASIKSQIPRYVLHRHYKNEPIEDAYDPQDLFSGEEERVKKASEDLWRIWETSDGLKNNWRIYVNGQIIKPSQVDRIPFAKSSADAAEKTLAIVVPQLLSSAVFAELKQLQSSLDPVDISTLATCYQQAYPNDALFDPALIAEPDSTELEAFVEKYLEDPSKGVEKDGWTLREHMIAYALSAIFKDCSIFVSVPLAKAGDEWTVKPGTKVKIIDLDLKDVKSLRKWHDLDRAIWEHWLETHPPVNGHGEQEFSKDPAPVLGDHLGATALLSQSQGRTSPHGDASDGAMLASRRAGSGQETSAQPSGVEKAEEPTDGDNSSKTEGVSVPSASQVLVNESGPAGDQVFEDTSTPVEETTVSDSHQLDRYTEEEVETRPSLASDIDADDDEDRGSLPAPREVSSTSEGRKKRSSAPTPSPTPFKANLPDGLAAVPLLGGKEATVEQRDSDHVDNGKDGVAGIALGLGLATIGGGAATALFKNTEDGRESHENDTSSSQTQGIVDNNEGTTDVPEASLEPTAGALVVPMESSSSDESGRVDEFVTPMAEMPESSVVPARVEAEVSPEDDVLSSASEAPRHVEQPPSQPAELFDTEQPIAADTPSRVEHLPTHTAEHSDTETEVPIATSASAEVVGESSRDTQITDALATSSAIPAENDQPSDYETSLANEKNDTVREAGDLHLDQPESVADGDAVKDDKLGSILHLQHDTLDTSVEVSSEPPVTPTNDPVSQGSQNATSVTGEALENNRLPAIASISAAQIRYEGPSGLMVDKVDDVPITPAKRDALVIADFEPHSLPPVLERGESTLAVGQSDPVTESVPIEGPTIGESAKPSVTANEAESNLDGSFSQEDLAAANPAISIDQVPHEPDAPVTEDGATRSADVDDGPPAASHLAVQQSTALVPGTPSLASDTSGIIDDSILNTPVAEQASSVGSTFHLSNEAGSVRSDAADTEHEADGDAAPLDRTDTLAAT